MYKDIVLSVRLLESAPLSFRSAYVFACLREVCFWPENFIWFGKSSMFVVFCCKSNLALEMIFSAILACLLHCVKLDNESFSKDSQLSAFLRPLVGQKPMNFTFFSFYFWFVLLCRLCYKRLWAPLLSSCHCQSLQCNTASLDLGTEP